MANDVVITIKGKDQASKVIGGVQKKAGGLGSALKKVGTVAGGFLAANVISGGMQKLSGFFSDCTAKAKEQMLVESQLDAVLKSTGGTAGWTAEEAKKLASALQETTNFGDETTISAQNMLLTFTGIGRDVFPEATAAALDMATALGTDAVDASKMIGMALNDPIQGISRLTRSGIVFTEEQKEQIKTMSEAGDVAGAQAVMLAELNKEFGGSAEAAVAADGGIQQAENAMGDLQEKIGYKLIPVMVAFKKIQLAVLNFIVNKLAPAMRKLADRILPPVKEAFKDIKKAVQPLIDKLMPLFKKLKENESTMTAVAAVVGVVLVAAFLALGVAAAGAAVGVIAALAPFIAIVVAVAAVSAGIYLLVTHFDEIKAKIIEIANKLWNKVKDIFNSAKDKVVNTVKGLKDKVVEIFNSVIDWVKTNWPLILAILTGPFGLAVYAIVKHKDEILGVVTSIKDKIVETFNAARDRVRETFNSIKDTIVGALNDAYNFVTGLPGQFKTAGENITKAIGEGLKSAMGWVIGAMNSLITQVEKGVNKVIGLINAIPSVTLPFGGGTIGIPHIAPVSIPRLDTGGLVTRTGLAEVHKGETYSGVGKAGGLTVHLHVAGSILAERDVKKIIADGVRQGAFRGLVS